MRKFTKSWYANVLLGLLTLSFVSWGAGSWFSSDVSTAVATVGGTEIDQAVYRRDYNNVMKSLGREQGKPLTAEEAKRMKLGDRVLEQDIADTALDNATRSLGLTASDALITAEIQRSQAFAGLTGQFDRQTFQRVIEQAGYSEAGFLQRMRSDIAHAQLVRAVEGGFQLPTGYARAIFAFATELRAAEYIVIDAKSVGNIAPPSDAVLQDYVRAHPNRYSTPEYRDVTYAWATPDDVANQVTVTDDQIKQAYDSHIDQFVIPEKRELQQIQFGNEAEAKAAEAKLASGTGFDQITNAKGEKPVPIGDLVAADLDSAQAKVVFALKQGQVSPPMKAPTGNTWVIMKVVKVTPGSSRSLDQAKDEIRKALLAELAQSKLTDIANNYTDASSSGLSLSEAAKKVGMHVARVPAMDANGNAPDGSKASAPDDPDFRKLVFRAEPGEEGDPQPLKTGTYVVSVNGVTPPKVKPLDQVRAQAITDWTNEQRAIILKKKAQDLATMINRDHQIDSAAKSVGATVQQSPALRHGASDQTFSPQLVAALFQATPGQAVVGPKGSSGDWVVARLTGIVHPRIPENSPLFRGGVAQISQEGAAAITESYVQALRAEQGVQYNTKLIQSVIGGETGEGS